MTDKIMKTNRITRILAGFCLLGAVACAKEVTEESYGGGEVVLGIDDNIQMYPLGGSLTIHSYYPERLYIDKGDVTWITVKDEVKPGESFTISVGANATDMLRSCELKFSKSRGSDDSDKTIKTIKIEQDAYRFKFAEKEWKLGTLKGNNVTVNCESNVNYSIRCDNKDFKITETSPEGFKLSYPIGEHNKQREIYLDAYVLVNNKEIKVDSLKIIQDPYWFYFDVDSEEDSKEDYPTTHNIYFDAEASSESRPVKITSSGTPIVDSVKYYDGNAYVDNCPDWLEDFDGGNIAVKVLEQNTDNTERKIDLVFYSNGYQIDLWVYQKGKE